MTSSMINRTITTTAIAMLLMSSMCMSGCGEQQSDDGAQAQTASDTATSVAASIDGHDIMESDVSDYISRYRTMSGYTTDATWATYLDKQGASASDYRDEAIESLEETYVAVRDANSEGITVSDDDVDAAVAQSQTNAGYDGDASGWATFLDTLGYTPDSYRKDVGDEMLTELYVSRNVTLQTPDDADMKSYASNDIGRYTGKKVYSVSFSNQTHANGFMSAIDESNVDISTLSSAADSNSGTLKALGWSGMSSLSAGCTSAISDLSAGQASSPVSESDGNVYVYYVEQEFTTNDTGTISVQNMPRELYDILYSETSAQMNKEAASSFLSDKVSSLSPTTYDMPSGLPYDVDIASNSTYSVQADAVTSSDSSTDSTSSTN